MNYIELDLNNKAFYTFHPDEYYSTYEFPVKDEYLQWMDRPKNAIEQAEYNRLTGGAWEMPEDAEGLPSQDDYNKFWTNIHSYPESVATSTIMANLPDGVDRDKRYYICLAGADNCSCYSFSSFYKSTGKALCQYGFVDDALMCYMDDEEDDYHSEEMVDSFSVDIEDNFGIEYESRDLKFKIVNGVISLVDAGSEAGLMYPTPSNSFSLRFFDTEVYEALEAKEYPQLLKGDRELYVYLDPYNEDAYLNVIINGEDHYTKNNEVLQCRYDRKENRLILSGAIEATIDLWHDEYSLDGDDAFFLLEHEGNPAPTPDEEEPEPEEKPRYVTDIELFEGNKLLVSYSDATDKEESLKNRTLNVERLEKRFLQAPESPKTVINTINALIKAKPLVRWKGLNGG